jgi:hypothetical protein
LADKFSTSDDTMTLSVVVTIVDGGLALARCLEALIAQEGAPGLEILVPFDESVPARSIPTARFPQVTFVPLGLIRTAYPVTTALGQHELFDRRRAAGLAAATGTLIAMIEDRGVPRRDWAATFTRLHAELPHAAIGGAIESGSPRVLNRAVYFCDFGRYQRPFDARSSRHASDINVCYKRAAIESIAPLWRSRYHEPTVHAALLERRDAIFLSPEPVVDQVRGDLCLSIVTKEQIGWGRLYASVRVRDVPWFERVARAGASPLLPALLFFRVLSDRVRRRDVRTFWVAAPSVVWLLCAWSIGEAIGYVFSRGDRARPA